MIKGAGLGVAMGNAIPEVVAVASRRTLASHEAGVAHAIDQMLAGVW
jgi:hydroxymethylpyrimidine pyrophosphatase-like HAD family hydrolase